jgi:transcriptional regulator GlxA family with amidase domain
VEAFARANFSKPIGVDDLARVAGMSRFHFGREYRKQRGITPGKYLAALRFEQAMELLQGEALSVSEIAERCGFGNADYFSHAFRKRFGFSPTEYRGRRPARG